MGPDLTRGVRGGSPGGRERAESTASGSSFHYSFLVLPAARRRALRAVYDFCRVTDDLVDNEGSDDEKLAALDRWREEIRLAERGDAADPVLANLAEVSREYNIPFRHYYDLVRGAGMDLTTTRYATFADLSGYCALVASSVGLMCLDIFGRRNDRTEAYAHRLGLALQLTNIIRDVAADARFGRIYLPREDLSRFGCSEEEILAGRRPAGFGDLMSFEAARTFSCYAEAEDALLPEDLAAMAPARAMAGIYRATLKKIVRTGYEVFGTPIRLARPARFLIAMRYLLAGALDPR